MSYSDVTDFKTSLKSPDDGCPGAEMVGVRGIDGVAPTGKPIGSSASLQSMLEGIASIALGTFTFDTSRYSSFSTLLTAIGSTPATVYVNSLVTLTAHTTVPSTIHLVPMRGGGFTSSSAYTLTVNGSLEAGEYRWIYGSVTLSIPNPGNTLVAWFYDGGGDYANAINSAFSCRGDAGNYVINPQSTSIPVGSTITLANHHVFWNGYLASPQDDTVSRIIWSGAAGGTLFASSSGVVGCRIENIAFDGAHKTKWLMNIDLVRRSEFFNITLLRSTGFIYSTNCYYSSFKRMVYRLQTPGTYVGGAGQITLADWQAVCNSGSAAPVTFRSNANNIDLDRLSLSRVGAYEIPGGGSAITQMILLSGQNIQANLGTWESVDGFTVASGAEDGDLFGYSTGIFNDQASQLANPVIAAASASNTDDHVLYGTLTNSGSTRTVNLYSNSGRTTLVATGSRVGDGIIILHPQNSSGLHGQITVTYTTNDSDWYINANYQTINNILNVASGTALNVDNLYVEQCFAVNLAEVNALFRGGAYFGRIYMEDSYFSGSVVTTSSLKDLKIGEVEAVGCTFGGSYLAEVSTSTFVDIGQAEFHNRFADAGGVNYSDETLGKYGLCATSGYLPVLYRPQVVSGLTATNSSDSISAYIQLTPGSIRDGLGRSVTVGRYESVNSISAKVGWRFRVSPGAASYNLVVDCAGCVFIENQSAPKSSDDQGKIILAAFTVDGSGVITAFTAYPSAVCLRGVDFSNGGGITVPGNITRSGTDIFTATDYEFRTNTSDGSDNRRLNLCAGGATSNTRSAIVQISGNEHATPGSVTLATGNVTGSKLRLVAQGTEHHYMDNNGYFVHSNRFEGKKGSDVTSANDITLGAGNCFTITGTTQINRILTTDWQSGATVSLILPATIVLSHNTAAGGGYAGFWLSGLANWTVGANGGMIQLTYDGTYWRQSTARVDY